MSENTTQNITRLHKHQKRKIWRGTNNSYYIQH